VKSNRRRCEAPQAGGRRPFLPLIGSLRPRTGAPVHRLWITPLTPIRTS